MTAPNSASNAQPQQNLAPAKPLSNREVDELHRNADTNKSNGAIHHTLGINAGEAAPGRHRHNGTDSLYLLDSFTITGSRSGATASVLSQILLALKEIGINDATSA